MNCLHHGRAALLLEGGHAIVETNLFNDLAILELQHSRSSEMHLPALA
jgi:hypothetical protein